MGPDDDKEIRPIEEITDLFTLDGINKAPAYFDLKKLFHINAEYIRALSPEKFVDTALAYFELISWKPINFDPQVLHDLAIHIQERIEKLADIANLIEWLFKEELPTGQVKRKLKNSKGYVCRKSRRCPRPCNELSRNVWDEGTIAEVVNGIEQTRAKSQVDPDRNNRKRVGLPLFKPMEILGRQSVLTRLRDARANLT